jgi:hypothetical protein
MKQYLLKKKIQPWRRANGNIDNYYEKLIFQDVSP